jgi:4'-phosphopantetheinyl transferase
MTVLRLHPVIRRAPGQDPSLPSAVRAANQRRGARAVCRECAHVLGHHLRKLTCDGEGHPVPMDGWYWDVSHTGSFVGGVVAPFPVGMAVERVRHHNQDVVRQYGEREEYELLGGFRWQTFARLLSAKLAVLHKTGRELTELDGCRLAAVPSDNGLVLHFQDRHHFVNQRFNCGHYAAVCADLPLDAVLEWDWRDFPPGSTAAGA